MNCTFCQIIEGSRRAHRVYEDEKVVAFLDHRPLFPGHTLVAPRRHAVTLPDLEPAMLEPLFGVVRRLSEAVPRALGAQGSFVAINNRVSQSVPRLHIHVVPRNEKDGLRGFFWPRVPYQDKAHVERTAQAIREALND